MNQLHICNFPFNFQFLTCTVYCTKLHSRPHPVMKQIRKRCEQDNLLTVCNLSTKKMTLTILSMFSRPYVHESARCQATTLQCTVDSIRLVAIQRPMENPSGMCHTIDALSRILSRYGPWSSKHGVSMLPRKTLFSFTRNSFVNLTRTKSQCVSFMAIYTS